MDELSSVLREVLRALGMEGTERVRVLTAERSRETDDALDPRARVEPSHG